MRCILLFLFQAYSIGAVCVAEVSMAQSAQSDFDGADVALFVGIYPYGQDRQRFCNSVVGASHFWDFAFVGGDVLVSTGALGNQAKLLCRAARYAGMREIESEFFDLLDMAADTSTDFDLSNNTREFLLAHFSLTEGKSALEKAKINKKIYEALEKYGD